MKNKKLFLASIMAVFVAFGCNEPTTGNGNGNNVVVLPNHEVIYELFVRQFSPQGNFAGVTKDIPRLKELGVDILWLMPIHPIGEMNRKGTKGSPYSVKDYKAINPDFGTAADFKELIKAAHEAKMKVIIDWVANHTAWDNVWTTTNPDYYKLVDGNFVPPMPDWEDVIQLNYDNPNMRTAMIDAMKYWVTEFDIDGFRCDYTYGVPADFWQTAIADVNQVKPLFWLSEGDDPNRSQYFDADYTWNFAGKLNDFGKNKNVAGLKNACLELFNDPNYANMSRMDYITNHDFSAWHGTEFDRFGANVFAITALFFTIYDMPLLYNGQEYGINQPIALFNVDIIKWGGVNAKMKPLVKKMIDLKHSQPALENGKNRGSLTFFNTDKNSSVLVYTRAKSDNQVLVMLNFTDQPVEFSFTDNAPTGEFSDWLSTSKNKTEFSLNKKITIGANGYQVWVK